MREQEFRRGFRAIASGFALAMVAGVPGALAAPVGFVTSVAGRAEIQADSQASWQAAALDGAVSVGDSIRTGTNAGVEVLLVDDTVLSIGEDSELFIDRMIVGDLASRERSILRELRGQVRAQVGSAFGGMTRLEIHTPTAIVGVRGSTMNVRVERGPGGVGWITLAAIQEGVGFVCGSGGGGCLDLRAGQLSEVPQGGLPGRPTAIPKGFNAPLGRGRGAARSAANPHLDIDRHLGMSGARGGRPGFHGPAMGRGPGGGPSGGQGGQGGQGGPGGGEQSAESSLGQRRSVGGRGGGDTQLSGGALPGNADVPVLELGRAGPGGAGPLVGMSERQLLTRQSLNVTNGVSQNVGPAEAFDRIGGAGPGGMLGPRGGPKGPPARVIQRLDRASPGSQPSD